MPRSMRGIYRDNPGESMKRCRHCGRTFHHMGIGPHERACEKKTPAERRAFAEHHGKYAWKQAGEAAVSVPATARLLSSPVPTRRRKSQLPAPNPILEYEGQRIALTLSFDTDTVRDIAQKLFKSVRLEKVEPQEE